ncbi:MAG: methyltransferase domain-containing protein [Acidobacteriota bacterium]
MSENPLPTEMAARRRFFDAQAPHWDDRVDPTSLAADLARELAALRMRHGDRILDLGCGTGNLTLALRQTLPPGCRVAALDLSFEMLRRAQAKLAPADCVDVLQGDAFHLPFPRGAFDVILCYSTWPHLEALGRPERELERVLGRGGRLQVWHSVGRNRIREIHGAAGPPVEHDLLPPADRLAERLEAVGLRVERCEDRTDRYLVRAVKAETR